MSLILLEPPAEEPLALSAAKDYLRIEHNDDDDLITALITAARLHVEAATGRLLITQSWRLTLDVWPVDGVVKLPLFPLNEITAVRVIAADGTPTSIDPDTLLIDAASTPARLYLPAPLVPGKALAGIEIDADVGYGAAEDVPAPLVQAIRLLLAHWYENRALTLAEGSAPPLPASVQALLAPYRMVRL